MSLFLPVSTLLGGAVFTTKPAWLPGYASPVAVVVPAAGAHVKVFARDADQSTATPIPVYPNHDGTGTALTQPLTADADGRVPGYVQQPLALDLALSGTGLTARTVQVGLSLDLAFDPAGAAAAAEAAAEAASDALGAAAAAEAAAVSAAAAGVDGRGTTAGDLLVFSAGAFVRLGAGGLDQVLTVRSDGTVGYGTPRAISARAWGAGPSRTASQNVTAIQAAIARASSNLGAGPGDPASGSIVDLPAGTLMINQALLAVYGTRVRGVSGRNGTTVKADGTASLSSFQNGTRLPTVAAMLKWDGGDNWAHGVQITGIRFDPNGVAGLSATWFQEPGENFLLDDLRCDSTVAVKRTVADAQIVSLSNVVTFTASTVTEDDVNAYVTDRTDGDFTLAGPAIPAFTKIDLVNWANPAAFPPQSTATSVTLNTPATASVAGSSFTIYRTTDAFVHELGAARGYIGTLNGISNQGALLRLKNFAGGTWMIECLSGDNNWGGLLRISRAGNAADACHVTVLQLKAENQSYNPNYQATMDPVVLLDRCATLALNILGGTGLTTGGRDFIRIDQAQLTADGAGPSIELGGVEGQNWYNAAYTNIIRDSSTGEVIPSSPYGTYHHSPRILWGRNLLFGGGAKCPMLERWTAGGPYYSKPVASNCSPTIVSAQGSAIPYAGGFGWYNFTNLQGDWMSWLEDISPGTYDLAVTGSKNNSGAGAQAIVTVEFGVHVYSAPAQPTVVTAGVAGSVPVGSAYPVWITYVTANGETQASTVRLVTVDGTTGMRINSPAQPPPDFANNPIIGWYAYVGSAGGTTGHRQQTAGSPTPIGTNLTLTAAPSGSGATQPTIDTSGSWTTIGTWDQYGGGALAIVQFSGVVIPTHNGPIRTRFRAASRNGSNTTGWIFLVSGRHWQRTA